MHSLLMPKSNEQMPIAHGSGCYAKLLAQWAKIEILVFLHSIIA
ncbi:Transposase (plasmid) [Mycetohabitans rhizoxinica HKI 454]|uniref:Transposase n=1 Tax=Mycetohabitans rhizoxinica (strain DSM 19002 / CIP 109453 / HKI 454) TaxID=882378 RepID=E5AUK9_MYCRK|nr:Transposase [Mycetohabitans rhizoxinica HKI 454]